MEVVKTDVKRIPLGVILAVLLSGMFVTILNQTLINVALPSIMTQFNISTDTAQWLSTGFMLVNGMLIPISAFLIETFGFRKLFIAAMAVFTIGTLICATSQNFTMLLIGRIVQAMGAGITMPLGTNVFLTAFPAEKRGAAMGMMGVAMIFAPAIGPTLTGWVIENYNWNLMFYGITPISFIVVLLAFKYFHLEKELSKPKFHLLSIILSSVGFGCILYAFSDAGTDGWDSGIVIINLLVGIISLLLFVLIQLKSSDPILDMKVYKSGMFTLTTIIGAVLNMAMFGGMLLLPIYLQNIRGFTPLQSGLLIMPGSIIMGIMTPIAGKLFDKYGAKWLAIFGLTVMTIATYLYTKLDLSTSYSSILGIYVIRSFGMSFLMMTLMTAGLNALPRNLHSHGTAMSNTIRQVASSLGTAYLVTVMTQRTAFHLGNAADVYTKTNAPFMAQFTQYTQQIGLTNAFGNLYTYVAQLSVVQGINDAFMVATILAAVALILSFFIKGKKKQKENKKENPPIPEFKGLEEGTVATEI